MRICLAGPPLVEHLTRDTLFQHESERSLADRVPLGVLTLAALLEKHAFSCSMVDLNRSFLNHIRDTESRQDFVSYAVDYLAGLEFNVLGLGTMCSSYPATLQIAAAVKARRPQTVIVLGGPQASIVDVATIERFKAVDIVVRGEADDSIVCLANALQAAEDLGAVPGITYRKNGVAVRTAPAPGMVELDALPLPAFHLLPDITKLKMLPLELGRGCPFSCTFCSTNDFFRRRFRLKKPDTVIGQMRVLNEQYGVKNFILAHDMFTVDRKRVVEFCQAVIDSGTGFEWSCSARSDSVDKELLDLMAQAGCRGLFFGIETGSARMQLTIDKDLDLPEALAMVKAADEREIETTVSTIIGFPEEELCDVEDTLNFLMEVSRLDFIYPQVGLLAPLAGTPVYHQFREQLRLDPIMADFAYTAWYETFNQFEMIKSDPEIFCNFFAVPTKVSRQYLFELKLFFHAAIQQCRWLLLAAHQELGGIMSVFAKWFLYRPRPDNPIKYYTSSAFKHALVCFLEGLDGKEAGTHPALHVLIAAQKTVLNDGPAPSEDHPAVYAEKKERSPYPALCQGVELKELPGDVERAIAFLKGEIPVLEIAPTRHLVRHKDISSLVPLNERIEQILTLCDGSRETNEIMLAATGIRLPHDAVQSFFLQLRRDDIVTFTDSQCPAA